MPPIPPPRTPAKSAGLPSKMTAGPSATPVCTGPSGRSFVVKTNDPNTFGKKVVLYGPAGAGKSSLAALAPGAVIFDLNKGLTGLAVKVVDDINNFSDLREATAQALSLVPEGGTMVVDTMTEADEWIGEALVKDGRLTSISKLGYDKFPCSLEKLRLLLSDFDALIRNKRNVLLLCHEATINFKNALGNDFRQIGPKMMHSANDSCRDALVAWSDHTFRVALAEAQVEVQTNAQGKVISGKAINRSTERYITTDGTQSVVAKTRPVLVDGAYHKLPSLIAFAGAQDATLWEGIADPRIFDSAES
jgi:hypothetical protein